MIVELKLRLFLSGLIDMMMMMLFHYVDYVAGAVVLILLSMKMMMSKMMSMKLIVMILISSVNDVSYFDYFLIVIEMNSLDIYVFDMSYCLIYDDGCFHHYFAVVPSVAAALYVDFYALIGVHDYRDCCCSYFDLC